MTQTNATPKPRSTGWQDWATRTTTILAVLAALSSGRWGASNLQAILEQGKVNDQWAYFQSKSTKEHGALDMEKLTEAFIASQPPDRAEGFKVQQGEFAKEVAHEAADKDAAQKEAWAFEGSRDKMVERGFWFEISFAALQLGVIMSTIAAGAKARGPWIAAMLFGVFGLVVLINGFHTFYHAPKSWYSGVSEAMANHVLPPGQTH